MAAAAKLDPADEEGVVLTPEEEDELDRATAEAEEDLRTGRCITANEMRAKFRAV